MRELTFKIKFRHLRDKWHEILTRPEYHDGLTVRELMAIWKREERVRRASRPSSYGGRLEPKYGPANDNAVGNLLHKDRRFKNLRPSRVGGVRTGNNIGLWVASATLNTNHTTPSAGEVDGQ